MADTKDTTAPPPDTKEDPAPPAEATTNKTDNATPEDAVPDATESAKEEVKEVVKEVVKVVRAVVLTGFGGSKMMKVVKRPEPTAAAGEVLVRVKACGMNFQDLMVRQGVIDHPPKCPVVMGFECAGEVEAVGEGVTDLQIGDRVMAFSDYKAWSELVAINAHHAYKVSDDVSFRDAAAILMSYVTAYAIVFDLAGLREGQTMLAHSLGGGVGQAIVQMANTVPNVTIFGTASTHKHEVIRANGNVTHLFDHSVDYTQAIRKESSDGVDIVLDCLCGDDTNKGIALIKPMGKYILYGSSNIITGETKSLFSFAKSLHSQGAANLVWWQVDKVNPLKLFDDNKVIGGFQLRKLLFRQGHHEYVRQVVGKVMAMHQQGKITPQVDSVWAFEDVGDAMQKLVDRKNIGKVILDPTLEPKPKKTTEKAVSVESSSTAEPVVVNGDKDEVANKGTTEGAHSNGEEKTETVPDSGQ